MKYQVVSTGSVDGNCVVLDERIMIDCGVPYSRLQSKSDPANSVDVSKLEYVLLTHHHGDHINLKTLSRLYRENPDITFLTPHYLAGKLVKAGIYKVREVMPDEVYLDNGIIFNATSIPHKNSDMSHCPNVAWKIRLNNQSILYVTDTHSLEGLEARGFDYYFIEMNFKAGELEKLIQEDIKEKGFSHRVRAQETHLALELAEEFLRNNVDLTKPFTVIPLHMSSYYTREFTERYKVKWKNF